MKSNFKKNIFFCFLQILCRKSFVNPRYLIVIKYSTNVPIILKPRVRVFPKLFNVVHVLLLTVRKAQKPFRLLPHLVILLQQRGWSSLPPLLIDILILFFLNFPFLVLFYSMRFLSFGFCLGFLFLSHLLLGFLFQGC